MEKLKKWIQKNKMLCALLGIIGMLLAPFFWPFILAVVVQSLALCLPVVAALFLFKRPWKEKETCVRDIPEGDDLMAAGRGEEPELAQNTIDEDITQQHIRRQEVSAWYRREGRERILRLKEKADQAGIHAFSVSREGFCAVRKNKKYRRIGVIRNFPREGIRKLQKELQTDGMNMRMAGKYLWVSWGEEVYS